MNLGDPRLPESFWSKVSPEPEQENCNALS